MVDDPETKYLHPTLREVAEDAVAKAVIAYPEAIDWTVAVQVGAAEKIPEATVMAQAPEAIFPTAVIQDPD